MIYFRVFYKVGGGEGGLASGPSLEETLKYKPPTKFTHPVYLERVRVSPSKIKRTPLFRWNRKELVWSELEE